LNESNDKLVAATWFVNRQSSVSKDLLSIIKSQRRESRAALESNSSDLRCGVFDCEVGMPRRSKVEIGDFSL